MAHALIFDSGVGGLSVVAEIRDMLPDLRLTYVADDVFRPYGEKSEVELRARLPGLLSVLSDMTQPDVIVIACNTASTTALEEIRKVVNIPVIGVVPAIKPAAKLSQTKTIAVLGTPGTVQRKYVGKLISDFASNCKVILHGSVGLVSLAEKKLSGETIKPTDIKAEINDMFAKPGGGNTDMVVLACTHFPLLKEELQAAAPHNIVWIDSGQAIARRINSVLGKHPENASSTPDQDVALLIGPDPSADRKAAFVTYGFNRVVGLMG